MSYNENLEFDRSNRVPLVFITDENFAISTCVAIISLIENKDKDTFYDIFIIADRISIETEYKLFSLKKDDVNIQLIHISSEKFEGIHEQGEKSICVASLSALFKFEIPNILPLEDKILYLDGDILVRKDLNELFNINVENFYVAAAHDTGKLYFKRPIIKKIPSYFNSGVMLLNLKRLRENKIPELLIETKKRQKTNLMDQDVFNIVLKSGVKHIDIKYNFLILNLHRAKDKYKFEQINTLFNSSYKDLEDVEEKSHIIHFSSRDKPWKFVDGVYSKQWFSYFRKSPFRDPPNLSDIKLAINEYSQEYAELSTPQNKIKKLKNQIKNLEGEVDQKNHEINALKWTMETHKQLIENFKAESRSIKQIYLEKNISFSPDYGKLTVIMPYRRTDDPQREENLDINLNYLSKLGIKNLIISQHSDESAKKFLIEKYGNLFDYFKVYFSYADGKLFNKSCAINQGVIKSKTPYIAIFDIDGLIRKENINQAIYLLDKGFEVVHPFDRLVKDIVDKKSFIEDYDFEKVKSPTQQRDWADGGIVFWNKRSFIDIGMKNEHITGWGSEDNEIIFRSNIFQLKQIRIDDILYHLYHDRLKVKTRDNFEKMKKMMYITSKEELLKEINQWPWLKEAKKTIHEDHGITAENTEFEEKLFSKKERDLLEPIVKDPVSVKESDFKKDSAYKSYSDGLIYKKKKFNKLLYFLYILKKEKLNPKNIYKIFKARRQIKSLNLFDEKYYLTKYPHLRTSNIELLNHYLYHGWKEEKNPSRTFDGNYYLKRYLDVKKSKTNPLVHYVLHGKGEGRFLNNHAEINSPQNVNKKLLGRIQNLEKSLFQSNNNLQNIKKEIEENNQLNKKEIENFGKKLNLTKSVIYDIIGGYNKKKYCPICQKTFLAFLPYGENHRPGAQCPNCGSLERHRGLFLFLNKNPEILNRKIKLLHFAPEPIFFKIFSGSENIDYHPVDINPELYGIKEKVDMQNILYEESTFDLIYNSHVLEHVPDDIKAMKELYRVVKPKSAGGMCIIMAPVFNLNETLEKKEYNTPKLKTKYYGQHDHIRKYGRDFQNRLEGVGFDVEVIDPNTLVTDEIYDYGNLNDKIYLCTKPNES